MIPGGPGPDGVPDRWLVVEVPRPTDEGIAGLLVEELLALGSRGVEEHEHHFTVYLPPPRSLDDPYTAELATRLAAVGRLDPSAVSFRWQPHEEWAEVWRNGLAPRRVTPRIVVTPTWMIPEVGPEDLVITLDPGLAFGTAEHPTTRGCLRLMDGRMEPGDRVADIGAGSAILSIGAALLGAGSVLAVELDPWACQAARENVQANGVSDRVTVRAGAVGPDFLPSEPPLDGILANIESSILLPLIPGFATGLRPGGWVILSGILREDAAGIIQACRDVGLMLEEEDQEKEWWSAAFRRPSAHTPTPSG